MPDNEKPRRVVREQLDLPSNSHKARNAEETTDESRSKASVKKEEPQLPVKKTDKVTTGKVIKRKRGTGAKMKEAFFGEDVQDVGDYVVYDVAIPAAKNLVFDLFKEGLLGSIEMVLFGGRTNRRNTYRSGGRSYTSYGDYFKDDGRGRGRDSSRDRDGRRELSRSGRSRHDFDEIIFESRGEAEEVLDRLVDLIIDYGMVAVADFYDAAGISSTFADNDWGWTNLSSANVTRVRGGYLINLPKTQPLK